MEITKKKVCYYKILNVDRKATKDEIKKVTINFCFH